MQSQSTLRILSNVVAGFNADLLARLIERTVLNPALVLPLLLVAQYTSKRHAVAESYKAILRLLKLVCCFGLARWLNGILNRGALNNWQVDTYDRSREVAVVTGGSDGIGKLMVQLLATKTTEVAVLDIQPLRFESSTLSLPKDLPVLFFTPY